MPSRSFEKEHRLNCESRPLHEQNVSCNWLEVTLTQKRLFGDATMFDPLLKPTTKQIPHEVANLMITI